MEILFDINGFLKQHNAHVDDDNRLHLSVLCDGTGLFLYEMIIILMGLKCSDIEHGGYTVTSGIPEDKPWCNYKFTANGILPEYIVWTGDCMGVSSDKLEEVKVHLQTVISEWRSTMIPKPNDDISNVMYIDTGYIPNT